MEYISRSESKTSALARKIALRGGHIFALSGNLGSGKTTFAKGIALALGIKKIITSPTFLLMKNYEVGSEQMKINLLVHIDAYRLGGEIDGVDLLGLEEYFTRDDVIVLIEWPEKIASLLPPETKWIKFEYLSPSKRKITL